MNRIVLGILAHVDAGKTTLSESLLYLSGTIRRMGRVDNKDAFLDTNHLERERGITIFSKQAVFALGDNTVTLLDTPGHVDFSAEMERTLQVLDYAILVVSGADGVQGHTRTLWRLLRQYKIPVFVFINKMDQPGTDRQALMQELNGILSDNCISFRQEKEAFYDQLAMCSEEAMEAYLETGKVPDDMIRRMIRDRQVFPCYFGSALKPEKEQDGVRAFLEGLDYYMQVPDYPKAFGARVFKIARDAQGNRLTFMKITGGCLKAKDLISGDEPESWQEKVNQIRIYSGEKYRPVDAAYPGDVCAVTGLTMTRAGGRLGADEGSAVPILEPVLTYSVNLPDGTDPHRALLLLRQLEEEEPELHIVWDEDVREIHMLIMGEIQTEVLVRQIEERFGLRITFGSGKILYKETIAKPVEGVGHFEPLRHYAEVHLLLSPGEPGTGLCFDSTCSENALDRNWQRLILTHLAEKQHKGVLTGSPVTDMKITLVAGKAHPKHTEGGDFRQATYRAVRQGLMKAENIILEPYYRFTLEIPTQMVGRAMTDLEQMYARFELENGTDGSSLITGTAPVSTMREYHKNLAAYTSGLGRLTCSLGGYMPCHNPDEVWQEMYYDPDRDLRNTPDSVFCAHGAGFIVPWYEVESYMHLPGLGLGGDYPQVYEGSDDAYEAEKPEGKKNRSMSASIESDKELMAIFERTYGKVERKLHDTSRTIRAPGSTDSEYVYKPAKKKPVLDHYLLVDGYNIIFAWPELAELSKSSLEAARSRLMDILSNYQGYTRDHIILVFDAYKVEGSMGEVVHWHNIDVVYTKEAETADQYIEKTAHVIGRKYRVTVATSDGTEQVIIRSQGCMLLSARDFLKEVERINTEIREGHLDKNPHTGNYLGNYMPENIN